MNARKRVFILTKHASKRMKERDMPHPMNLGLVIANRKTKKAILTSCPKIGVNPSSIYWTQIIENERLVYVTNIGENVGEYIVITCFKYNLKDTKKQTDGTN